jgi:hypothetical protein
MNEIVNDTLALAAAYIEAGWTKHSYARDAEGGLASPTGAEACEWCLMGGVMAASQELYDWGSDEWKQATHETWNRMRDIAGTGAVRFNDAATDKEQVLNLISEAYNE